MKRRLFSGDHGKFSGGNRQPVSSSSRRRSSAPDSPAGKKCWCRSIRGGVIASSPPISAEDSAADVGAGEVDQLVPATGQDCPRRVEGEPLNLLVGDRRGH